MLGGLEGGGRRSEDLQPKMMWSDSLQPPHPEKLACTSITTEIDTERSIDIQPLAYALLAGLAGLGLLAAFTGC